MTPNQEATERPGVPLLQGSIPVGNEPKVRALVDLSLLFTEVERRMNSSFGPHPRLREIRAGIRSELDVFYESCDQDLVLAQLAIAVFQQQLAMALQADDWEHVYAFFVPLAAMLDALDIKPRSGTIAMGMVLFDANIGRPNCMPKLLGEVTVARAAHVLRNRLYWLGNG